MNSVYRRTWAALLAAASLCLAAQPSAAQAPVDPVLDARDALRRRDAGRLALAKASATSQQHPLAQWVDYWELQNRLQQADAEELNAFFARWPDTYVADRLRNDWLLELGRRNDWATFSTQLPRFRMQDDKQVDCYAVLARRDGGGDDLRAAARKAWMAQREADQGCSLMALTLYQAGVLTHADIWRKARLATEAGRRNPGRQAVVVVGTDAAQRYDELYENPARYLARRAGSANRTDAELTTLALVRLAASDPEAAAAQLEGWTERLPQELSAWAWAAIGRQAGIRLSPRATEFYQRASQGAREADWSDDMLAWKARAALRAGRWQQVSQAINAMPETQQADSAWVYWKARALQALARDSQDGEKLRAEAHTLLDSIAGWHDFYGKLAAEDLGRPLMLPARPAALTDEERDVARRNPGLQRALQLFSLGLRGEAVREWNWTLSFGGPGGARMNDRQLLAAAQIACDREIWDRCINTSDRTEAEFHIEQRFPMPFRREVVARAREIGLDPAYVYGLIRQESRFVMDVRSHVGASGLMQLMPATARWTARRIGINYTPDMITDRNTNIALGTSYLKLVLDDVGGSQAMGAAAYNAGPGRPRRWREGAVLETPIWIESIPFSETRDYVKKVLSNATYYGALISGRMPSLKARLGPTVGPRDPNAPPPQTDLP
ncbi:lytic transglycosylase domain-containing protein [Eleftheria terrae]|nr:lytic transglycosylase domain-containing protein [Eleftheria terrae]WKB50662.1 lytic transglycosylase domain-containing protein [Eleftheria terrae]